MANLAKLDFVALDISGNNYLSWILDAEIHLDAMGLGSTIKTGNKASIQDRAKAMIFLRHHLHESLKGEYLTIKEPLLLWKNLQERYNHQKTIILPKARDEWTHLRLQDFKSVCDFNSSMFRIVSQLRLCGEDITDGDMLEKTFTTFHASNIILQQQYREKGFKKYSELISCLLVAEQNNKLLLKNHESRPTGSSPFLEVNTATFNGRNRGRGPGRGRGRGGGRGRSHSWNRNGQIKKPAHERSKKPQNITRKVSGDQCLRCGMKGHWSRTCRTPKHLVELYQASLKEKENTKEVNLVYQGDEDQLDLPVINTRLDVEDYINNSSGDNEYSLANKDIQD
ncbi:hypothetical protein LUZ60_016708 [Juncus effusus]|nr:hypothetical protein LUZ60_016708 [Juncus effusus]